MRSKPLDPRLRALIDSDPAMTDRILRVFSAPPSALVSSPGAAAAVLAPLLAGHSVEHFAALALNRRNRVIAAEVLTIGTDASGFCSLAEDGQLPRWSDSMSFTGEV
jgi:DNA repair protein RadC